MSTKVKIHYCIENNGDGSASVHFFKNNKLAEIYDQIDDENYNEAVNSEELEFDENGELLDNYCTDVKERLKDIINDEYCQKNLPNKVERMKELLKEIEDDE